MFFEKVGVGLESKALRAQCLEKSERFFIFELCSKCFLARKANTSFI